MAYLLIGPDERLDYQFDWSDFLAEGDSVSTYLHTVSPTHDTSPETPTLSGATTDTVTIEDCIEGRVYRLAGQITTANGIVGKKMILLRCGNGQ